MTRPGDFLRPLGWLREFLKSLGWFRGLTLVVFILLMFLLPIALFTPDTFSCKASEGISKMLERILAFGILGILGYSTLRLFGATLIKIDGTETHVTKKAAMIIVVIIGALIVPLISRSQMQIYLLYLLLGILLHVLYLLLGILLHGNEISIFSKSLCSRVLRSRATWLLKAGWRHSECLLKAGWYHSGRADVRIGLILCVVLALPSALQAIARWGEPGFPWLRWGIIFALSWKLIESFLTAALPEEILFRGFLQTSLTRKLGTNWGLILASWVAFGFYHFPRHVQDLAQGCWPLPPHFFLVALIGALLSEGIMGLFLGFAFASRGSLVIPIMVHTWINTIAELLRPGSLSPTGNWLPQCLSPIEKWVRAWLDAKGLYVNLFIIIIIVGAIIIRSWLWPLIAPRHQTKISPKTANIATPEQLARLIRKGSMQPLEAHKLACRIVACRAFDKADCLVRVNVSQEELKTLRKLLLIPIDINAATAAELEALPGIGPVLAQRIIDYRETKRFETINEIKEVRDIKEKKFEAIKDKITV